MPRMDGITATQAIRSFPGVRIADRDDVWTPGYLHSAPSTRVPHGLYEETHRFETLADGACARWPRADAIDQSLALEALSADPRP